jgi:cellulose biosynthesis protein BcsQ
VQVLSISALKGGVGKTTVTLGLASAAMSRNLRTLVIDLDPQCNASIGLGAVGDFEYSAAEVIKKPRHNTVLRAIVVSSWAKGQTGRLDIMVGNPKLTLQNKGNPSFRSLWNIEQALATLENEYDLVLIDTPPSLGALTRMAWVASDRVLLVAEPAINSVISIEAAIKAFVELRNKVNRRVNLLGVLVNRLRASVAEHQYRVNELDELFGDLMLNPPLEEKTALQQSSGAGKSIHSWPGQSAAKLASRFDALLETALEAFVAEDPGLALRKRKADAKSRFSKRNRDSKPNFPVKVAAVPPVAKVEITEEPTEEPTVSPEYEEKFQEVIRQTMTKKQIEALKELPAED